MIEVKFVCNAAHALWAFSLQTNSMISVSGASFAPSLGLPRRVFRRDEVSCLPGLTASEPS